MKTIDYLRAAKRALGITSDYALAKQLAITRASMSLLVNGHSAMSNTTAARVAELLDVPLAQVIADMELERGSSSPELWKRIRDAAVVAVVAIGLSGGAPDARAARFNNNGIVGAPELVPDATEIHIASHRRRRQRGAMLARLAAWLSACCALSFSL